MQIIPASQWQDLKADAGTFADYLFYPYDRVGIVALTSQTAGGTRDPVQLLALDSSQSDVDSTICNLKVFQPVVCPQPVSPQASPYPGPCLNYPVTNPVQNPEPFVGQEYPMFRNTSPNDPSTVNSTDVGDGLLAAADEYYNDGRQDSFWATVLLLTGSPNSTEAQSGYPYGLCPHALLERSTVLYSITHLHIPLPMQIQSAISKRIQIIRLWIMHLTWQML